MLIFFSVLCSILCAGAVIGAFLMGVRFGEGSAAPIRRGASADRKTKTLLDKLRLLKRMVSQQRIFI